MDLKFVLKKLIETGIFKNEKFLELPLEDIEEEETPLIDKCQMNSFGVIRRTRLDNDESCCLL